MGRLVNRIDAVINEAVSHGVVFILRRGRLGLHLRKGRPPDEVIERIKSNRKEIYTHIKTDWAMNGDDSK